MLTRFYCDNYKCFVNFEFFPTSLQLLIGRNGSGKSTLFEALELLRDFAARGEKCEERFGGKTCTRWLDVSRQKFEMAVAGPLGLYTYKLIMEEGLGGRSRVQHESVTLSGAPLFLFEKGFIHLFNNSSEDKVQFPFDSKQSGLAVVEPRPENTKLTWFKSWLDSFLYIQIDPKAMSARAEKEAQHPEFDMKNFANWYRHLRLEEGAAMEALRSSLTEVIGGFESLDLKDAGLNTRVLQVSSKFDGKPANFTFDELSDGQRALIGLYTLLHRSSQQSGVLCIDEPDNFVALAEIQPWLDLLRERQEGGLQVIVASHHPELLNQLATGHGVVLERQDGRYTKATPFTASDDLMLTAAEIVARGWESV